jgi:hypothetical protein
MDLPTPVLHEPRVSSGKGLLSPRSAGQFFSREALLDLLQRAKFRKPRFATWLVIALLIPSAAQAYIDPNTGSTILFRFLFPMFVAIGAGWVFLKNKISTLIADFRRKSKAKEK